VAAAAARPTLIIKTSTTDSRKLNMEAQTISGSAGATITLLQLGGDSVKRIVTNVRKSRTAKIAAGVRRNFVHEEDDYSWEDLQRIEKRRRNILRKGVIPFFGVLLQWEGSVLRAFFRDPLAYFLIIFYVVIRGVFYLDKFSIVEDDQNPSLGVANIEIIGGFLTFFLIFYAYVFWLFYTKQPFCFSLDLLVLY